MDEHELKKLALLSRIDIDENELKSLRKDMESILNYVSAIKDAPAGKGDRSEPSPEELMNVLRDDAAPHESGIYTEALLKEAPRTEDDFVRVKKIL